MGNTTIMKNKTTTIGLAFSVRVPLRIAPLLPAACGSRSGPEAECARRLRRPSSPGVSGGRRSASLAFLHQWDEGRCRAEFCAPARDYACASRERAPPEQQHERAMGGNCGIFFLSLHRVEVTVAEKYFVTLCFENLFPCTSVKTRKVR